MAQSSSDNDLQSIGKLCLELCQASVAIGHVVKLSLNIGSSFSFNYSSEKNGNPLPAVVEKPKKKSRATLERDRQRRAAFLLKKAASSEICPPLAVERPLLESQDVTIGHVETILSSSSSETRSSDTESNDFEDNPESSVTLLSKREDSYNTFCICSSVPCVCLASKPLSPIRDQPVVPKVKIKKTKAGWSSSTSSPNPLCDNCGQPFLNSEHQCVDDHDDNDNQEDSKHKNTSGPEEDILDYQACHDCVVSGFFSPHDKHLILQRNCISLLKIEPIDFKLAKFCFSRSKYFQLRQSDQSLGISMQNIVNIFDKEFEDEMKKHYN